MFTDWWGIHRQRIAFVDNAWVVAEIFGRAVVIEKSIVLPLNVMQFGEDVGGNLLVPPQFVGEKLEAPAHVPIAIERADAAVFAIDERLALVLIAGNIVKRGADVG